MGVETHNPAGRPDWLDLLHREADGELTAAESALLAALPAAVVAPQRERLDRARRALAPRPGLPGSVAAAVAREISWGARMQGAAPVLPRSVAAAVVADLALDRQLTALAPAALPHSVAGAVVGDLRLSHQLTRRLPPGASVAAAVSRDIAAARLVSDAPSLPGSVAAAVAHRIAAHGQVSSAPQAPASASSPVPASMPPVMPPVLATPPERAPLFRAPAGLPRRNPAPLILVVSLLLALTGLAVSSAWPNLAAGALVLRTLLAQISPVAGAGLALLLLTSALVTWRPTAGPPRLGGAAFALSAALTLPALYGVATHGTVTFGQNVTVSGAVTGNVIAVGGNVNLRQGARVQGEVVTLLGDVYRQNGAQVQGHVSALLGHVPGDRAALQTPPPQGLAAVTAAAFRPVLGWLGGAAWPQVFVTLTAGALLLLFVSGVAPLLARRQRHAPVRTMALGVLVLAALLGPAGGLALAGLLGPALLAAALAGLLLAVGLSVSAYDAGRVLAHRAGLPVPEVVGALVGLSAVAASLSVPPVAFTLAVVGGTWGAGTLLSRHRGVQGRAA